MSNWLRLNFLISLVGTFGSLYFSEIVKFPPCTLCWYQRIFLYPLVFIFSTAVLTEDANYKKYAAPLVIVGLAVAAYHNLLYYGVISEALTPCTKGVSCSSKQLELFGFITIPLLSLGAFLLTALLLFLDRKKPQELK